METRLIETRPALGFVFPRYTHSDTFASIASRLSALCFADRNYFVDALDRLNTDAARLLGGAQKTKFMPLSFIYSRNRRT